MRKENVTSVYVKSTNGTRTIKFLSPDKPEINAETFEKWQSLVNGIIKLNDGFTRVFLKSENEENPYKVGSTGKLCIGTYCEEVMGSNHSANVEKCKC